MSTGRRERKKQELRERIVDAADTLIAEHGLAQTTVDQIAELADIAQTTFFNYFPTKAAVVDALVERLIDQFNEVVDQAHGADSSIAHKIETLFRMSADLTEGQHRVLRDVIAEAVRTPRHHHEQSLSRMRDLFTGDIAAAQERGEARDDSSAESLADAVLGLYVSVVLFWSTDAAYPVADRLRSSAQLAIDLIAPRTTSPRSAPSASPAPSSR
jgi:AcrR family transcriptional regulator